MRAAYLAYLQAKQGGTYPVCEEPGCTAEAVDVDHIDGRGPLGDNSFANLRGYCKPHHNRKTLRFDGGWGNPRRSNSR